MQWMMTNDNNLKVYAISDDGSSSRTTTLDPGNECTRSDLHIASFSDKEEGFNTCMYIRTRCNPVDSMHNHPSGLSNRNVEINKWLSKEEGEDNYIP